MVTIAVIGDSRSMPDPLFWDLGLAASKQAELDFSNHYGREGVVVVYDVGLLAGEPIKGVVVLVSNQPVGGWIAAGWPCLPGRFPLTSTLADIENCP
jgi:hypothetical protein